MPKLGDLNHERTHFWNGELWQWQPLWIRPADVVLAVRERFGAPAHALDYLGDGCLNQSWSVTAEDGRRYVLRVSRSDVTRDQVEHEHALATALHKRIDVVVAPLPGVDGRTTQLEGDRILSLFPFVEGTLGTQVDPGIRARESAVALAKLHRVAVDELEYEQRPGHSAVHEPPRWLWHEVKPTLLRKLGGDQRFQDLAAAIDREVAELDSWLDELAAGRRLRPIAPIHGDFNPRNLLFRDDRLVGIIDFDGCHLDSIAWEVAQVGFGDPDVDPMRFFRAYRTAGGPLEATDFELLGGFARIGCLSEVQWSVDDGTVNPRVLELLTEVVDGVTWLRDRDAELRAST
jgi:Ser/Thr protein kinase RdoA (MazF antagonist)